MNELIIRQLSVEIKNLHDKTIDQTAIRGFISGASYSLKKALKLNYSDYTDISYLPEYRKQLSIINGHMARGKCPLSGQWLAGFYFNSALQRLASGYERILKLLIPSSEKKMTQKKRAKLAVEKGYISEADNQIFKDIQDEVDRLKHDPFGSIKGREPSTDDAIKSLINLVKLFKRLC